LAKFPTFSAQAPCNGTSKYMPSSSDCAEPDDSAQLQGLSTVYLLRVHVTASMVVSYCFSFNCCLFMF